MTKGKWFEYRKGATRNPPAWFKTISEWPDVLIRPSESFRVKIKAAEIVQGTEFATAKTLRFPRCIWVFNDEADPLESAMTMDDLTSMQGRQKRNHNGTMTTTSKRLKGVRAHPRLSLCRSSLLNSFYTEIGAGQSSGLCSQTSSRRREGPRFSRTHVLCARRSELSWSRD